jgi:GntR family transcriptional regulator of arabinose operon
LERQSDSRVAAGSGGTEMSKKIGEQSLLKYEKLYNWGRTLITSGVIQNEDKFPSENILQKKFGYSRQTVRTALNQLEAEGLIKRVKGSGTYVSYEGNLRNGERPRIGLILSYFSDYLFPRVYDGIDSVMKEAGYDIDVAVTKNRLNDEAIYLEGLLNGNVAGFIIEGTRSFFPNPNIRLYEEIRKRNIPTLFIHNHYSNQRFDSVEMSDARAAYKLTEILIQNGHRRIAGIFKYDDMQGIERYKGFVECLSDYGVKFDDDWIRWYSTKDMEEKLSKKGLLRMYRRTKDCTAMIVYNDEVAGYYMEFLEERGLHVPEDVSLVSFDDEELQQDARVKVLSVVHPKYNLGRITGKNLLRMMDDPDWQNKNYSYRFPVSINDGNSVKDIR